MQFLQQDWSHAGDLIRQAPENDFSPDFVLFFGPYAALQQGSVHAALKQAYPKADLLGCSTGGQFSQNGLTDERVLSLAVKLERASSRLVAEDINAHADAHACGAALGAALAAPDLRGILVLSDGVRVNGSALVAGLAAKVGQDVQISGGLAGDGGAFVETLVSANAPARPGRIAAMGFYGAASIRTGSAGGWDAFGPRRIITKSEGNVLFTLDGAPALDLYERYLGEEEARNLPGSALLFPLRIDDPAMAGSDVMRTILGVDHKARSMIFAGDVPQGWRAQLMRGSFDRLAEGAGEAARQARGAGIEGAGISLFVSCIGRRLLMGQRIIDEIAAARAEIAPEDAFIGFYSYGEIAPHRQSGTCQLHNQTMTVFSLHEGLG